jgi:hypothetical protein
MFKIYTKFIATCQKRFDTPDYVSKIFDLINISAICEHPDKMRKKHRSTTIFKMSVKNFKAIIVLDFFL